MMTVDKMNMDLQQEATRLVMRYCNEVVVHFNFCPWARNAIRENRINISILDESTSSLEAKPSVSTSGLQHCAEVLSALDADPKIELVLFVFPSLTMARIPFDDVLRNLRQLHELQRQGSGFAMAAFHPSAHANFFSPERLIPFIRRTPFPIIQAVKVEVLKNISPKDADGTAYIDPKQLANFDWKRLSKPEPLRKKIAKANFETIRRVGEESIEERLRLIFEDRNAIFSARKRLIPSQWV